MKRMRESVVFKSITAIIFPLTILALVVSVLGYRSFTDGMMTLYEKGAVEIAQTAAAEVDADRMDEYAGSGGETAEYQEAWACLDRLCNTTGATFIYVIRPDPADYGHITFLFSTINHESTYTKYDFGYYRVTTNDDYKTKYRRLYDGVSSSEIVVRDSGYIETDAHITAMVPLTGRDGQTKAILCVQRQMEDMAAVRNRFIQLVLVVLIVLVIAIIIVQHFYLRKVLLMPVKKITEEAVRFAAEEVPADRKLTETVKNRDEIGMLAGSIDHMEEQIVRYIDELTLATAEKERIRTELSLATRIQANMLPRNFPPFPDRREFDLYASMTPAKEVGGDFYDFFLIDDDHLLMLIADVSGKGIPAALFMMASKIMIKSIAMNGVDPHEILETANNRICQNNGEEMFITVWLGILDLKTGLLKTVNAGHEYPAVTGEDGRFELLKSKHDFVIGGMEGIEYRECEMQMKPGQKLFVYTDGVAEATDSSEEMYGQERMLASLNSDPEAEPQRLVENVRADVERFVKDAPQFDDMTMLCLKYNGPHG